MRTFISINPGEETKKSILKLQSDLINEVSKLNEKNLNSIRWEDREKFHITLFFIGEVSESQLHDIVACLKKIEKESNAKKLVFSAKGINAFPKLNHPRVLILELENEDKSVFHLTDKINLNLRKLNLISDKTFRPHITLARVMRNNKVNLTGLNTLVKTDLKFSVTEFQLMKSELRKGGSEYSVIEVFKL